MLPLQDEEYGSNDRLILTIQQTPWSLGKGPPEPGKHTVFTGHVMSAGCQGARRGAPEHIFCLLVTVE